MAKEKKADQVQQWNGKKGEFVDAPADLIEKGATLTQIRTSYQTAIRVQKERNIKKIAEACVIEASLAGESFYYAWKITTKGGQKKIVDGVGINGAQAIARNFGNCAVEIAMRTPDEEIGAFSRVDFTAWFIDLEQGYNLSRIYSITIQPAPKKFAEDEGQKQRWYDMQIQKGQSFAQRNVILRGVPSWLVDRVKIEAKKSALKGIKEQGLEKAIEESLKYFEGHGVDQQTLEQYLECPIRQWTPDEIVTLRGIGRQIEDGYETPDSIFTQEPQTSADLDAEVIENDFWNAVGDKIKKVDRNLCKKYIEGTAKISKEKSLDLIQRFTETFSSDKQQLQEFVTSFEEWKKGETQKQ